MALLNTIQGNWYKVSLFLYTKERKTAMENIKNKMFSEL